jgi:two-component system, OmpR family, phosphate regulon response regulator PhoB
VLQNPSVLIIGQAGCLQAGLEARLRTAGCRVVTAPDGRSGVACVVEAEPDVILLDADLPDADALDVCREIRRRLPSSRRPVFLLTPEQERHGELGGTALREQQWNYFEYGFGALLAWIESASGTNDRIDCHGLILDRRRFTASVDGRGLPLTTTEFRLLWALAVEPGRVFRRQELASACGSSDQTRERTVDVHVKSIRDKLGVRADLIETVQRVGYRLREWNEHDQTLSPRSGTPAKGDSLAVVPGRGYDR